MKKEEIRKEFFKLRMEHHSYNQCRKILDAKFGYRVSLRTLYRWTKRLHEDDWDLTDCSIRPRTIHYKITPETEKKVLEFRSKTGWGQERIQD
jgi:transposase